MDAHKKIVICSTLDTKGEETLYLKAQLEERGAQVSIIDIGLKRTARSFPVQFTQDQVAESAGSSFTSVENILSRFEASKIMMEGLLSITQKLCREGNLDGMMSLGGSGGTTIASYAMQNLPLGIPKIIVGTMASGNTVPYVQGQDILLINSVADIQSINFLTEYILGQAAAVMCAMIDGPKIARHKKKAIGITGFGVTTPCVQRCKELLEEMGYEIVIFHARGVSGGKIMEKMIRERFFAGVLDITTTELADEVGGGAYAIGPERLRGGVETNIPYIVVPGALEMINIGPEEQLAPPSRRTRSATITIRAFSRSAPTSGTCGRWPSSSSTGSGTRRATPGWSSPRRDFPRSTRRATSSTTRRPTPVFTSEVKAKMPPQVPVITKDCHLNDPAFAELLVRELIRMIDWDAVRRGEAHA